MSVLFLSSAASAGLRVGIIGGAAVEGGAFFVEAQPGEKETLSEISGAFRGGKVEFFPTRDGKFGALVGVEYGAEAKPTALDISYKAAGQQVVQKQAFQVDVRPSVFPSEKLKVPPRTIEPSEKDKLQIARDNEAIHRAYATITLKKLWDEKPILPVNSQVTSQFGASRVYNGKKHNPHLGTDLRASMRTRIVAPMGGQVALARKTFYLGNLVILDHGFGVFTIYGHFSELSVKEGRFVKKGDALGLAGATGRVSGPHLHWAAHLNGVKVDPLLLVSAIESAERGRSKEGRWIAAP